MKSKARLLEIVEKYAVEPYKSALMKEIQPSIRLKTTGEPCTETGQTKLGGCPDLPRTIGWPTSNYDGRHLSFLGQVNLGSVRKFDEPGLLPPRGILYFFFNPDSGDDGKVIFSREETALERTSPPDDLQEEKKSFWKRLLTGKNKKRMLKESRVEISTEYDLPSADSLRLEKIHQETRTVVKPAHAFKEGIFEDMYDEGESETSSNHHLTGHYKGIQNEFHELNCLGSGFSETGQLTMEDINAALQWKLLFQFDSDNNLEFSFADWGRIYFFIHEDDLKKQNFDNVKISADCY